MKAGRGEAGRGDELRSVVGYAPFPRLHARHFRQTAARKLGARISQCTPCYYPLRMRHVMMIRER
jgi:hypothetical protein